MVNVCWGAILKAGLPVDTPLLANLTRKGVDIWVVRAFWGHGGWGERGGAGRFYVGFGVEVGNGMHGGIEGWSMLSLGKRLGWGRGHAQPFLCRGVQCMWQASEGFPRQKFIC